MRQNPVKSTVVALTLLTLTTALSACSTAPERVVYAPRTIERPTLILPKINVLDMKIVDYIVITPENAEEIFAELRDSGQAVVLFAVTEEGYQNLSLNMAEILEVLSQQNAVIAAYEDYYVETTNTINDFNNQ